MSVLTLSLHWHGQVHKFICKHWGTILTPWVWPPFHPIPPKLLVEKDIPSTPAAPRMIEPPYCVSNSYGGCQIQQQPTSPTSRPRVPRSTALTPRETLRAGLKPPACFGRALSEEAFSVRQRQGGFLSDVLFSLGCFGSLLVPLPSRQPAQGRELSLWLSLWLSLN